MTSLRIAISHILELEPNPIHCMTLNHEQLKLALFRGGEVGSIEIWDVSHLPFLEKVITDLEVVDEKASVESMVWIHERLFSCGLHGFILEHDLRSRRIKSKTAATSGPVWCIQPNPDQTFLAAGTEDGFVNIFEIYPDELIYLKVLDRQEGRLLCLSWSPCGKFIATGSTDSLRVWDVDKGHALQRIMTGRSRNNETIVWSILMLEDFQVVTGDSRGIVSVWDGRVGVLSHKINTHKADVLSLVLSEDKSTIYASGVDPMVVLLARVGRYGAKWVKSHQRVMHTNDVMCLATSGTRLFSGGIDSDLAVSEFVKNNKIVTKYPPLPKPEKITMSSPSSGGMKRVLLQNERTLDIWQLPTDRQSILKLVELRSREPIHSSSMSPSGNHLAYSTQTKLNVFRLSHSSDSTVTATPKLEKFRFVTDVDSYQNDSDGDDGEEDRSSGVDSTINDIFGSSLHFISEHQILAISSSTGRVYFLEISSGEEMIVLLKKSVLLRGTSGGIGAVAISPTTNHIALANSAHQVLIYQIGLEEYKLKRAIAPHYKYLPTRLIFHPSKPYLCIVYINNNITIFDYNLGKILYSHQLGKKVTNYQPILHGDWSEEHLILADIETLYLMEPTTARNDDEDDDNHDTAAANGEDNSNRKSYSRKKIRRDPPQEEDDKLHFNMKTAPNKYKYIASIGFMQRELVAIEVKPGSLMEKLPPAFAKRRFGM